MSDTTLDLDAIRAHVNNTQDIHEYVMWSAETIPALLDELAASREREARLRTHLDRMANELMDGSMRRLEQRLLVWMREDVAEREGE